MTNRIWCNNNYSIALLNVNFEVELQTFNWGQIVPISLSIPFRLRVLHFMRLWHSKVVSFKLVLNGIFILIWPFSLILWFCILSNGKLNDWEKFLVDIINKGISHSTKLNCILYKEFCVPCHLMWLFAKPHRIKIYFEINIHRYEWIKAIMVFLLWELFWSAVKSHLARQRLQKRFIKIAIQYQTYGRNKQFKWPYLARKKD